MNKAHSRYRLGSVNTKIFLCLSFVVCFFNGFLFASSLEQPFNRSVALSQLNDTDHDYWILSEHVLVGQGEVVQQSFFSVGDFKHNGYCFGSIIHNNMVFLDRDQVDYSFPYFRNIFLYIRVINAP